MPFHVGNGPHRSRRSNLATGWRGYLIELLSSHYHREAAGPTFVLSHAVAAAVVRDADDRLAMLRAAAAIAKGNERAASQS